MEKVFVKKLQLFRRAVVQPFEQLFANQHSPTPTMKRALILSMLAASFGFAQNPPPPPPNPPFPPNGPGAPGGPPNGPNGRPERGPEGNGPNGQGPVRPFAEMLKRRLDGNGPLDQLGEEDRKRIRAAIEKVWNNDAVKSARDGAADAAKKYRDVLHDAAAEADPSIKPLLDKIAATMAKQPMGQGPFQPNTLGERKPDGQGLSPGRPDGQPRPEGRMRDGQRPEGQPNNRPDGPPRGEGRGRPDGQPRPDGPPRDGQPRGDGQPRPDGQFQPRPEGQPPQPPQPRGEGGQPKPEGNGNGDQARGQRGEGFQPMRLFGFGPEDAAKLTEDQRAQLRTAVEKITQMPAVKELREAMEKADGEGKRDVFRKLREKVVEVLRTEYPDLGKALRDLRGPDKAPPQREPGRGEGRPDAPPAPLPTKDVPPPAPNAPGAPESSPPK